jgi:hypothetical protein
MNVIVFYCAIGTWPTKRSPWGLQPIRSHHIGAHLSFVHIYEARGVKQPLLAHPASPRSSHVVSLALRGYEAFLAVMLWRAKKRESVLRLAGMRRLRRTRTISSRVKSGCSAIRVKIPCACFSKGETLPLLGAGSADLRGRA